MPHIILNNWCVAKPVMGKFAVSGSDLIAGVLHSRQSSLSGIVTQHTAGSRLAGICYSHIL